MAKAVLISIRPEWVKKILDGEKTLEVRKNRPNMETPFKVYIYCTKLRYGFKAPDMTVTEFVEDELPAADVEPERNGRWEECDWVDVDEHGFGTIRTFKAGLRCNQCACVFKKKLLWKRNYCPNCGSKMDLEDENNDD